MLYPAARLPAGTMYSIWNRKLSAGMYRRPHRPAKDNSRFHSYSRYSVSAHWPVFSAPPSYAAESRPARARLVVISYNQSSALAIFILFRFFSVLPESCSCPPFRRRFPMLVRSPQLRAKLSRSGVMAIPPLSVVFLSDGNSLVYVHR